jgi:phosphoribosylformylglycinamidine synthase
LGGRPPVVDLEAERALAELLAEAARAPAGSPRIRSAHDLSEGGLAQALVEACLIGGLGADISLAGIRLGGESAPADPFVALFAESSARVLLSVPPEQVGAVTDAAAARGVPVTRLGTVTSPSGDVRVENLGTVGKVGLIRAWEGTLPSLYGP